MTHLATAATKAGRSHLWRQWLSFEVAHPGAALVLSTVAVLLAGGVVLGAFALMPFPQGSAT